MISPRLATLLVLPLALAGAANAVSPQHAQQIDGFRRTITGVLEQRRWSPESIELDALLAEAATRLEAGEPPRVVEKWLQREVPARWYGGFAPLNPPVRSSHRYRLPFDRRIHWIVSQRGFTDGAFEGAGEYGLDFAMPEGTKVLAARGGTVVRVVDGFLKCGLPKPRAYATNRVIVLHEDGSFALYSHLRPGVLVAPGNSVMVGDALGYSGCTGYATTPRLRFEVSARRFDGSPQSIAFTFQDASEGGYVPMPWSLYRNRPAAQAELRVSVAGRLLTSGEPFPLDRLAPTQLQVETFTAAREKIDVTRDPRTRYVALTPWSLKVDSRGRVAFEPTSPQWAPLPDDVERGFSIVTILFKDADGREGFFDAWLTLRDPGAPSAPGEPSGS